MIKEIKMFLEKESALQMPSVVFHVFIIIMSEILLTGAWNPEKQRLFKDFTRMIQIKPVGHITKEMLAHRFQDRSRDAELM